MHCACISITFQLNLTNTSLNSAFTLGIFLEILHMHLD